MNIAGKTRAERMETRRQNRLAAEYARAYRMLSPASKVKRSLRVARDERLAEEHKRYLEAVETAKGKVLTTEKYKDRRLVGSILRKERHERGLTLQYVAEQLGKSRGYLSQLERGQHRVDTPFVDRLCAIYDCDEEVDSILGEDNG